MGFLDLQRNKPKIDDHMDCHFNCSLTLENNAVQAFRRNSMMLNERFTELMKLRAGIRRCFMALDTVFSFADFPSSTNPKESYSFALTSKSMALGSLFSCQACPAL